MRAARLGRFPRVVLRAESATHLLAYVAVIVIGVALVVAVFGPVLITSDPYSTNLSEKLLPPGKGHLFGTDQYGRDIFARIVYGTRLSFLIGVLVAVASFVIGVILGAVAGYLGGFVDALLHLVMSSIVALPGFLFALMLVALWGASIPTIVVALTIAYSPRVGLVMRSVTKSIRTRDYVEAAQNLGIPTARILRRYIVPNAVGSVIVIAAQSAALAILAEAALSFLGLGIQAPTPSWGNIIADGRGFLLSHPWITISPGIAILLLAGAINVFGEFLRDRNDPGTNRGSE